MGFIASAKNMQNQIDTGLLDPGRVEVLEKLILNLKIDTGITIFLVSILWIVIVDILRIAVNSEKCKQQKYFSKYMKFMKIHTELQEICPNERRHLSWSEP